MQRVDPYAMIDQQDITSHPLSLPHPHHQEFAKDVVGGPLYLHQQRTLEVIQLIEVPAPPREDPPSTFASSSFASSSYTSSESDEEDDSSDCESYCSSDPEELDAARESMPDDTYKTRQNRVLAWRETFAKGVGATVSTVPHTFSLAPPLKRKADDDDDYDMDDDTTSHSSKRSRPAWQQRSLSAHSCPACDESFSTRQSLQQHGRDSHLNNACRVAVEYGLEP